MSNLHHSPLDGDITVRVRRGRVESVDLYEIKDNELDHFENGAPGDLQLNFAIFLFSIAFSSICSLSTATFNNKIIENIFVFVSIIGLIGGGYLILSWRKSKRTTKDLCSQIRNRIPPDPAVNSNKETLPSLQNDGIQEPEKIEPPVG